MESRRVARGRRRARARMQGFLNVLLIVLLVVTFLILKEEVFTPGKGDDGGRAGSVNSVRAGRTAAAVEEPVPVTDVLILVNKDNKLPGDFQADLVEALGAQVDRVLAQDLKDMWTAAKRAEVFLAIGSAYRSSEEQAQAFNEAVQGFVEQGNTREVAFDRAQGVAARPGYSEHETGLAIDFSFDGDAVKQAEMWDWLGENAYKYGFILRYPEGKGYITGYTFEPWHYRYVGYVAAKNMYERDLVLEEYLGVAVAASAEPALMVTGAPGGPPLENRGREGSQAEEG